MAWPVRSKVAVEPHGAWMKAPVRIREGRREAFPLRARNRKSIIGKALHSQRPSISCFSSTLLNLEIRA